MVGRQGSVALTSLLGRLAGQSESITINIWNRMGANMDTPKWRNLKMEAPPPPVLRTGESAQVIAYYPKYVTLNSVRKFWISYSMHQGAHEARLCIYAKIEWGGLVQSSIFKYIMYVIRPDEICNDPPEANFVQENVDNGYKSDWDRILGMSAFASNGDAHTLNAYITSYTILPPVNITQFMSC